MTNEQAITVLNMIEAHGDLAIKAKELAIRALRKQIPRKCVKKDGLFVCSITRNYFKIYTDSEPSEIVEKISNLCGSREKLIEIWNCLAEEIADYNLTIKMGEWKINSDGYYPYCSECGFEPKEMTNYCPKCGALMSESLKTRALGKYLVKGLTQGLFESEETTK